MRSSLTSLNFFLSTKKQAKIIYNPTPIKKLLTTFFVESSILELAHVDDAADALARVHVVEGLVDAAEGLAVGDELVDLQLALHVVVDQVGEL